MSLRDAKPGDSAIVRQQLVEIEAALARGVRRQEILDILTREYGLTLKLRGFDSSLRRARKARDEQSAPVLVPAPEMKSNLRPAAARKPQPAKREDLSVNGTSLGEQGSAEVEALVSSNKGQMIDAKLFETFNETFNENFDLSQYESSSYKQNNTLKTPRDPYSARKARLEIQKRDNSDLEDDRFK